MLSTIKKQILMIGEKPMQTLSDRKAITQTHLQNIPPVVYQTWEVNYFGKTHFTEIQKFRALNPDLQFQFFAKERLENYMEEAWGKHPIYPIFKGAQFGPMLADIFRYCILFERGGFYFDISKGCAVSITSLCSASATGLISYEAHDCVVIPKSNAMRRMLHPEKYVLQWGMGFAKEHTFLRLLLENICEYYPFFKGKSFAVPKHAILSLTGPGMFTKTLREYLETNEDADLVQAGIDFNGHGIYSLKGSEVRYDTIVSYTASKNSVIGT
jgi:mannosyltransferase OCH1-like enzyme